MAKVKNKRNAGLADKVHKKKKAETLKKKINPFEVHINKEKVKVLGKKSKHDRGLPGVSRAKAIQKRKETLGTEMKLMNKTNSFIDKRIGEKNNQLTAEDRMIARFAAERVKQHSKKNIYNLADDEILTHRGQTLEQIEKFDDPRSSDDEDDGGQKFGGLDDDFVSEGHFGGGILSRTDAKDGAKSHKDLIEQLIAESKKRKAEKQKEKEQTLDLTEKLDSEWKDLQPVVFKRSRVDDKDKPEESIIDKLLSQAEKKGQDYDKMMRELRFERRGTPSDALKNEEKQSKEEKERIEKLEKERQQRMLGEDEAMKPQGRQAMKHRSADDLDDNFELDDEQQFMLAYDKDGKPLVPENILKNFTVPNAKPKFEDGITDTSSDENDDDDDEADDTDEKEEENVKNSKIDKTKHSNDDSEANVSAEDYSSSESESENARHKERTQNGELVSKIEKQLTQSQVISVNNKTPKKGEKSFSEKNTQMNNTLADDNNADESETEEEEEQDEEDSNDEESKKFESNEFDDLKDLKESEDESADDMSVEDDRQKIRSFFDLKLAEGDNLKELLSGKSPSQQSAALQKLMKSYDPSLAENNKELLSRLFAHMLQYVNDLFTGLKEEGEIIKAFLVFDKLVPHFYDLAHTVKVSAKKFIVELLKEKHDAFMKRPKKVPDMDTLIFLKLISLLYPTSDFRHPVTTPSLTFMAEMLTLSKFPDAYSISRGLFLSSLVLEYTTLSKRLVPAALNFLRGILYMCANTTILNPIQVIPPFRLHRDNKILYLEDDCSKMVIDAKMVAKDLLSDEIDNEFKIRCLNACIGMLREYFDFFSDLEAQQYLFEPHILLINRIDLEMYPTKVSTKVADTVKYMRECLEVKTFTPLIREQKRPKALRMYEPDVQEVFTGSKSSKLSREMAETARLQSKYKREMKGALREIRRDKAYIASVKIRQKIQSDNVRKEKVKQIYKDASIQQGELNKLKRMK